MKKQVGLISLCLVFKTPGSVENCCSYLKREKYAENTKGEKDPFDCKLVSFLFHTSGMRWRVCRIYLFRAYGLKTCTLK